MRTSLRGWALVAGVLAIVAATPSPAFAAGLTLSPSSGRIGSTFTATADGFIARYCGKSPVRLLWDGTEHGTPAAPAPVIVFSVTVPADAAVGAHIVVVTCGKLEAKATFEVTPEPSPTPTPTRTRRPTPSVSIPPVYTASPTPPTSPTPSRPQASPTPSGSDSPGDLDLDRTSITPGEPLNASGTGCPPGATVALTSGGESVGTATADTAGHFTSPVRFSDLSPGRRVVTADCTVLLTGQVDLVVSTRNGSNASIAIVLIFFVLVGAMLMRWQLRPHARP